MPVHKEIFIGKTITVDFKSDLVNFNPRHFVVIDAVDAVDAAAVSAVRSPLSRWPHRRNEPCSPAVAVLPGASLPNKFGANRAAPGTYFGMRRNNCG